MKPRNFPGRVLRRRARAKLSTSEALTPTEIRALQTPKDALLRKGAVAWRISLGAAA